MALTACDRVLVDKDRFGGLTAYDTRHLVYGAERRAILTHSPELHDAQAAGFTGTTLAKAGKKLDEPPPRWPAARPAAPATKSQPGSRPSRQAVGPRVIRWELTGDQPKDLRLAWRIDQDARQALENEIFGEHVLINSHDDWAAAEVIAGY